jgi:hypothetical protein
MDDFYFEDHAEVPEGEFETKVPADFRFAYAKGTDGVYRIGEGHAAAVKLIDGRGRTLKQTKATNQSVGLESRNRREALEKWEAELGFKTPEEAKAHLEDLTKKVTDKSQIKPDEIKAAVAKEYEGKLAEANGEKDAMFGTLEKVLRDRAALEAIGEHKGNAKLLMPLILGKTKVVKNEESGEYVVVVLNDKGEVRAGADGGPLSIAKLVAEMKEDKDLAMAFEGTKQSGGGTPPPRQQQQNNGGGQQQQQNVDPRQRGLSKISQGLAARG